jgi:cytochrome bd-type quinol oxidase subunit 2
VHDTVVYLLSNVPGLPPIVQTFHLLGIAVIMSSVVLLDLRILGLALPSQDVQELTRRVMPWVWWTLPVMLLSGSMFVFARPRRYFTNPIFGLKFALLVPAIALAAVLHLVSVRKPDARGTKVIAAVSLLLWIGVVLAGRWIAYVDYLFPEE